MMPCCANIRSWWINCLLSAVRRNFLPSALSCGRDFPAGERDRLFFLLSQMDKTDEGKQALAVLGATAFVRAYDADYNPLRQLLEDGRCAGASGGASVGWYKVDYEPFLQPHS